MRRTGSEEIGLKAKPSAAGIISGAPRVLPLVHFLGEAPERRPWILKHDEPGAFCPASFSFFCFYRLELPTDSATEPLFYPAREFPASSNDS